MLTDLAVDYGLIETLRWSPTAGFVRLGLHLDRMAASARQLGFVFDRTAAERTLDRLGATWAPGAGDRRVRLQLSRAGALDVTDAAVAPSKDILDIGLATARLDPGDPFLRHKTTRREIYERAFEAAAARGLDEVLFLNRRGEVAEASRNCVFVALGGRLITPPVSSGLLPGVLRRQLIESGEAAEANLSLELLRSHPIRLGNSLHGLRPANLTSVVIS